MVEPLCRSSILWDATKNKNKIMNTFTFIYILVIHYIADFVLQTHEEAMGKSVSNKWLLQHTSKYSGVWFSAAMLFIVVNSLITGYACDIKYVMYFWLITFVSHTITDYFTSRWAKKYFSVQDYHNGFLVVGFDQILHYLQLWFTFKLLL